MILDSDLTGIAATIANLAEPWKKLSDHNKAVSAGTLFFHLLPLIIAGGVAFAADRATLRAVRADASDRARQLRELARTHSFVVGGLTLSFISGILLFLADVESFWPSPFFWIKLACVALLLLNGFIMLRTEKALARDEQSTALWGRLRTLAITSGILWIATTLAGVVLKEFA